MTAPSEHPALSSPLWQPELSGALLHLCPLREDDFEPLHQAASDPLIWEQHPEPDRYQREKFTRYFKTGMESRGALAAIDRSSGRLIGCSRFNEPDLAASRVEIGYTFLIRDCWGTGHNREMKYLMLNHAFQHVETVTFFVGERNLRSQRAVTRLGARETGRREVPRPAGIVASIAYELGRSDWFRVMNGMKVFDLPTLFSTRMILEPIDERHTQELWELFNDPELHRFVPLDPPTLEEQRERCARWARRRSPAGDELWLNWAARERESGRVVAHLQSGVKPDATASLGYLVARHAQGRGLAVEGMQQVLEFLRTALGVREVRAWSDTRNSASHRVAEKLGMARVETVPKAAHFKGADSDEYVFFRRLESAV